MYSVFTSEVDRNTYEHDTLDCNWLPKGRYMRSVLTPATSVYAYAVAFGWIAGYLVLNLCLYRGYSQGSDFICHLGKILNGVAFSVSMTRLKAARHASQAELSRAAIAE